MAINLEIPVLVRSPKSSNVELTYYLDGRLFKCCLSIAANHLSPLDLINHPVLVVGSGLIQTRPKKFQSSSHIALVFQSVCFCAIADLLKYDWMAEKNWTGSYQLDRVW